MKAEALRCDYCGGFVNPTTYKCEYCGTQYKKPELEYGSTELKLIPVNVPTEVLCVSKEMDYWMYQDMEKNGYPIEKIVREDMAQEIAKNIADRMELYQDVMIDNGKMRFAARLRLVRPDYRFRGEG